MRLWFASKCSVDMFGNSLNSATVAHGVSKQSGSVN